ncbi:UNVERIFIED_CONTAM: hypothetical protein K2H54_043141 [Gekko kuhli]
MIDWQCSLSRAGPIPAILRPPPAMMQPPLDLKPFLSFPMEAQPAVGLFPGFNTRKRGFGMDTWPLGKPDNYQQGEQLSFDALLGWQVLSSHVWDGG